MLADQLAPLIALAAKKGVDLELDFLERQDSKEHGSFWSLNEGEFYADEADEEGDEWKRGTIPLDDRMEGVVSIISEKAAALIVTGSLSKWLAGQGRSVVSTPDVWWHIGFDKRGYSGAISLNATDFLSALISAATARLEEMQDKEKA